MKHSVVRAEVLGFCMGVRRAMERVEMALSRKSRDKIHTYGPLIHNPQVLDELSKRGVQRIDSPDEFTKGTVVIRAHGVPPQTREGLERGGAKIVDGTCPRVTRSMKLVEKSGKKNRNIILVGDPNHGEVKAIAGYADNVLVISTQEEAEKLQLKGPSLVIAQTTTSAEEYARIVEILESKEAELQVVNSICPATRERQEALKQLCSRVDAVVVIGGFNSSNTKRLHQLALSFGKPAWHIETTEDLPEEIKKYPVIGITAGASTPDRIIDEVEQYIRDLE
ncbi:MAG: 4-hydroxy-3-methylbut-2-enyl diphosphate reductase [Spirochaetaceae bacterium]